MLVPYSWLKEYVDIDMAAEKLAERLTLAGLEVGHIRYIGVPQQAVEDVRQPPSDHLVWDRERLLLGAIREVRQHPDADRLVLAMVDYGADEPEQCVTGAPNLYEYVDRDPLDPPLWTAFAMEGAEVWDGHSEEPVRMTLKGRKLRGIYNKSMVCSAKELGISDEHEGIMLLDAAESFRPGMPMQDVLGDVVFDIELTPNLGHDFSIVGVAREVAALTDRELKEPDTHFEATGAPIDGQVGIVIDDATLNPRFTATLLRDTTVQPSPWLIRHRLRLLGQRPINNIVDITNYITFELGQPLHTYDYDRLVARSQAASGNDVPVITTRAARAGETLETLDGITRKLTPEDIVVCDEAGILGLAGVIGGAETEISDATRNVLLEAASWNYVNIRKTAQAQKVFTEASTRFSRNVHPSRAIMGCTRGIELMRRTGGGTVAAGVIDQYMQVPPSIVVDLPVSEVQRLTGMAIDLHTAADVLSRLMFDVTVEADMLHVTVPDYRTDIGEGIVGQADLIEEIVRILGYDTIPDTIMADALPRQRNNPSFELEQQVRDLMTATGLWGSGQLPIHIAGSGGTADTAADCLRRVWLRHHPQPHRAGTAGDAPHTAGEPARCRCR